MAQTPVSIYLVVGGDYHDMDFARLELLKLFAEHPHLRVRVGADYRDIDAITKADFLVTYTCNVVPSIEVQEALAAYVQSGKRWFALHGTNSILKFLANGKVDSPETAPVLMQTLGSQFIAHPPIRPFRVRITDPAHPLVAGIDEFETDDELYLCRIHGQLKTLLETRYTGKADGFVAEDWPDDVPRPVYYLHRVGRGEVLYLNLGHCRGHYDMRPLVPYYPKVERGSWQRPEFYELLRRGIRYCAGMAPDGQSARVVTTGVRR